ncbi:electron transport complex subunit RsxG [Aliidiomarina minuta]|uniref:Ion-translocating oxidoreductase complex subunit G n=1 Tax=Aliidiomarina minuta TaxID=880057 RepID=A0A432W805_9GAMM|nr:electron transport complex subunit RsxG [Aliidiomarina minuta]RUO26159.1 electron transport complex subunit RsxG [Aliidiomarina minuta]
MIQQMRRNGFILAAFALAATTLVLIAQWLTQDRIDAQQRQELQSTLNLLIPPAQYNNDLYADCTLVQAPEALGLERAQPVYRARYNGEPVALALRTTAPDGYSGNIHLLVAVNNESQVKGVRVLQHRETPGLGDKIEARRSDWILGFDNRRVSGENDSRWEVRRDGGIFDQFSGATITPRAVVNAVQRTVLYADNNREELFSAASSCTEQTPETPGHPADDGEIP